MATPIAAITVPYAAKPTSNAQGKSSVHGCPPDDEEGESRVSTEEDQPVSRSVPYSPSEELVRDARPVRGKRVR